MTQRYQIYKCKICGGKLEVLVRGEDNLVCCGEKMELLEDKKEDIGKEKHVPVVEKTDKGVKIKVGSVPHPMEDKHYIEWIEVVWGNRTCVKFLNPGDKPEAEFEIPAMEILARAHCNIHGLWKSK